MHRVVVTGMGVLSPNAHGLKAFSTALRKGISGIKQLELLKKLNFSCQVAGVPDALEELQSQYFHEEVIRSSNTNMLYTAIAGIDCWLDAGLALPRHNGCQESLTTSWRDNDEVDYDTGAIIGTGIGGLDTVGQKLVPLTDAGQTRRLGSTIVEQIMSSSISARLGGLLALGGQVTTNSSACATGTEAIAHAYWLIKSGRARRFLAGGSEGYSHYIWGGFDGMRVLSRNFNHEPTRASRPLSASACGFVPAAGAGVILLERLTDAQARGAKIYGEIIGACVNSGGQRQGGSMTAPNPTGVVRCIQSALQEAQITGKQVEVINGHLTATIADPREIRNWQTALQLDDPADFPWINSTKSLIGHALGGAGGIETVAALLQLQEGFIHGSVNCEDLHPEVLAIAKKIPQQTFAHKFDIIAKASFGFGDVNACLICKRLHNA